MSIYTLGRELPANAKKVSATYQNLSRWRAGYLEHLAITPAFSHWGNVAVTLMRFLLRKGTWIFKQPQKVLFFYTSTKRCLI